jgi:hypothetical protein
MSRHVPRRHDAIMTDDGAPRLRHHHPPVTARCCDPGGNKVEAVCQRAIRSGSERTSAGLESGFRFVDDPVCTCP